MRFARNSDVRNDLPKENAKKELRRHGRVLTEDVSCSIGEILDLSASGMRVMTKFKLPDEGAVFVVTIFTPDGPLAMLSRVKWIRKAGFFKREAGLEFFDPGPRTRQVLAQLAGRVAYNCTIGKTA
jgi:hypothetical protein